MKKKKQESIESKPLINIERVDSQTYVKIKHPLRKNTEVYVSNIELNLLFFYSVKVNSKECDEYKDFLLIIKMIDNRNNLMPINYR